MFFLKHGSLNQLEHRVKSKPMTAKFLKISEGSVCNFQMQKFRSFQQPKQYILRQILAMTFLNLHSKNVDLREIKRL